MPGLEFPLQSSYTDQNLPKDELNLLAESVFHCLHSTAVSCSLVKTIIYTFTGKLQFPHWAKRVRFFPAEETTEVFPPVIITIPPWNCYANIKSVSVTTVERRMFHTNGSHEIQYLTPFIQIPKGLRRYHPQTPEFTFLWKSQFAPLSCFCFPLILEVALFFSDWTPCFGPQSYWTWNPQWLTPICQNCWEWKPRGFLAIATYQRNWNWRSKGDSVEAQWGQRELSLTSSYYKTSSCPNHKGHPRVASSSTSCSTMKVPDKCFQYNPRFHPTKSEFKHDHKFL